jgi:tetratricopeptide (TPR) repeat protein
MEPQEPQFGFRISHFLRISGIRISDLGMNLPRFMALAMLVCVLNPGRAATNDFFTRGLELSRGGQFPEAAAAFEKSAAARPAAGTLANLGLAEWQRGHAGAAILAWEQAQWIDPFDARAKANLRFARQVAQVDTPQLKWFEAVSTWLPPNAWVWLAGAMLWLALGLLVLPGIFRRRKTGWQQWLAALAFGIFLFSLTANFGVVSRTQTGFVLKKNAPLRLTPTREGEVISTLAAGEPARLLRERGNYIFIRTLGGSGWVERNDFGALCLQ